MSRVELLNSAALEGCLEMPDGWISLGGGCQVAYRLREYGLRRRPTALDWIRTPAEALPRLIDTDFVDLLDATRLKLVDSAKGPALVHTGLGLVFPHDTQRFIDEGYEGFAQRYRPRIDALVDSLHPSRSAIFVRRRAGWATTNRLAQLLSTRTPGSRLLTVEDGTAVAVPSAPPANVSVAHTRAMGSSWKGCPETWDAILLAARGQLEPAMLAETSGLREDARDWRSRVLGKDWQRVARRLRQTLIWRRDTIAQIPQVLVDALVAGEDHRFLGHAGVDFVATGRAVYGVATRQRLGGGSTIEQQLYRTLSGRYEYSSKRKMRELLGATRIAAALPKSLTARCYLCVAYFGDEMSGIRAACHRLGYTLPGLDTFEAADIVARLKYPEPAVAPPTRSAAIARRRGHILRLMSDRREAAPPPLGLADGPPLVPGRPKGPPEGGKEP